MARRSTHDAQVDPFNAGEPTLPWDDPAPFGVEEEEGSDPRPKRPQRSERAGKHAGDAETCAFSDEPYDGPTKTPDNYQAPDADESRSASAGGPSPLERKRIARAKARSERRAALAAPKDVPGARQARRARISRVIGLLALLAILPIVLEIASPLLTSIGALLAPEPAEPSSQDFADELDIVPDQEEARQACTEMAQAYIESVLEEGSPAHAELVDRVTKEYEECAFADTDELGIDMHGFTDWLLDNFEYEVDGCYALPDGTANLYFDSAAPSVSTIAYDAGGDIAIHLNKEGIEPPLTEAQKEQARKLHAKALAEADVDAESGGVISFTLENGTWIMDEGTAMDEIAFALGIWE